ncbi:MAG: hypothetical protein Q6368_011350, partial [Candidatus Baldrarchaeota archaeon]
MEKRNPLKELYKLTMKLQVPREILYQKTKEFFIGKGYLIEKERTPTFLLFLGEEGKWRIQLREGRRATKIELTFETFFSRLKKKQEEKIQKD